MWLMCNFWASKCFETETGDQVDDATRQLHLTVGNRGVCFNFIPSQQVGTMDRADFFSCATWSVNYKWHWEISVWPKTNTSDFRVRGVKKNLLILAKFNK